MTVRMNRRLPVAGVMLLAVAVTAGPATATAAPAAPGASALLSIELADSGTLSMRGDTDLAGAGTTGVVPQQSGYAFLGAPGTPVWALAPEGGVLPAWDTTGVPADATAGGGVTVELVDVDGPGGFHAYTLSPVGAPRPLFGTSSTAPHSATIEAGVRRGGLVWAFDTPGMHEVTLAATADLAAGGTATGEATLRVDVPGFAVPDQPPAGADSAAGGTSPLSLPAEQVARQPLAQQSGETGEGRVVIADGHVDIGPRFVDGEWTIQVKDDTVSPFVWRDLADVVLHAVDDSAIEVPEGEFGFLGDPGDTVWLLPQAQQPGILWPGWNTEDGSVVGNIDGSTTWRLHSVDGPGEFVLFLTASFGQPQLLFDSGEPLPQEMDIPLRTHAHGNWAFTEPGVYHLEIGMSATTTDGDRVSYTGTLAFAVGDVDPQTAFPGNGNSGNGGNGNGGAMPITGLTGLPLLLGAGALLVVAGAQLWMLARRRRANTAGEGTP